MAQSSGLPDRFDLEFSARAARPRRRDVRLSQDWELARHTTANVLVVGTDQIDSSVALSMCSSIDGPIVIRRQGERLDLPPIAQHTALMVLHAVDTLTMSEQRALCDWLHETNGRTRIVSTTIASLLPMLLAQTFSATLYYRLNTICIDLTARS